jgi:hypothetical protein
MIIKNISGEAKYFGFSNGVRGRTMANNATSEVPDDNVAVFAQVQDYVARGWIQVTQGPSQASFESTLTTPAFAYIEVNGAAADNDTVTVAGIVFEFENDPGAAVLGAYNANLTGLDYKWAGDGAAAATAVATLRTAVNAHSATTGLVALAPIEYISGKYVMPLTRVDGLPSAAGSFTMDVSGNNLAKSGGGLTAGVTGASLLKVVKTHTVVAGDVNNAVIVVPTGLTTISAVTVHVVTSAGVVKAWDGATLIRSGTGASYVVLNNKGDVDYAADDVVTVAVLGL